MQRLGGIRSSISRSAGAPELKKKAQNTWSAIQETFYFTKDTFERHRVVFTVGTSIASVATAWIGYSLRHLHDTRVDNRLDSIEQAMKKNHYIEHDEFKKIVNSGSVSTATCAAAASITLVLGYGLGWRGGKWYANRKFRKDQMKLLGQIKPRWKFQLRPLNRLKLRGNASKTSKSLQNDTAATQVTEVHG
ncbi:hypothetical protein V2J09_019868 [Rumex salicifolius]